MIKKELINLVPQTKKLIAGNVFVQWLALLVNIVMMYHIAGLLSYLFQGGNSIAYVGNILLICICCIVVRLILQYFTSRLAFHSSEIVKADVRARIYQHLLALQGRYEKVLSSAQVIQVTTEGVEQLETYFGAYMPQFFYAILAPLTLFVVFAQFDLMIAGVLLIGVWLIPVSIILVQKWAKKLLSHYWDQYTSMGDTFLENLQGLTTLKVYQADEYRHNLMNEEAQKFRKITMRVLIMQLNSISIMDLVAYGGAAVGMFIAIMHYRRSDLALFQAILVVLLAADFFLPMRTLGSFFHIAMNGMAASDKIFKLLNAKADDEGNKDFRLGDINLKDISFAYEKKMNLKGINATFKQGQLTAIVGESGSGKSTLAKLLMKQEKNYHGKISIDEQDIRDIMDAQWYAHVTYLNHQSYIFKGTVRENLQLGNICINDKQMWEALEKVKLADFLRSLQGLETFLQVEGSNLSGGQQQRLGLARALLANSDIYIFDEATSNIDVESEELIVENIYELAKTKMVIMISHRLANVANSDKIIVLEKGQIVEVGKHEELIDKSGYYYQLWSAQMALEEGED
ncbi:MAG: ABC transporter ATP-binding protein/permease [Erysipelotrichaceae bacterium]|nr:ABC transporter ATP-binding protein/permease [Erysipelotrichaceae bacterium]MDY5252943.1 ABC transporter ATP-binding protein/permease [Erysipelotrichaceae bacterium]